MKTYLKMLLRSVRQTRARFFSILAIVAIGVGFLGGLLSTTPDMEMSLDRYFDGHRYYDIDLKSPLGMTEDDLEAVKALDIVEDAVLGMCVDMNMVLGEENFVVRAYSADVSDPGRIGAFELLEGRLPQNGGECVVSALDTFRGSIGIGDEILLSADNEELGGFVPEAVTVCGIIRTPGYLSLEDEPTTVGNGRVAVIMYVLPECFDTEAYSDLFVTLKGAKEMNTFDDEYYALADEAMEKLTALGEVRSDIRFSEIEDEFRDALDEAKEEYGKAKKEAEEEFADAEKELADALEKLEEGRADLEQGKIDYENGLKELEDARKELEDGKKELLDGEKELSDKKAELETAKADIKEAEEELEKEKLRLEDAKLELADGRALFEEKKAEYEAAVKDLAEAEKELADGRALLEEKAQELENGKTELYIGEQELYSAKREVAEQMSQYNEGRRTVKAMFEAQRDQVRESLAFDPAALAAALAEIDAREAAMLRQLEIQAAPLFEAEKMLDESETELEEAKKTLEEGEKELEKGRTELENGEKELEEGRIKLQEAALEIEKAEKEFEDYDLEIKDGETQIADAEKQIADAKAEIADGEKKLLEGEQELADAKKELLDGEQKLLDGEKELLDAEAEIEDGEKELLDGEKEYEDGMAEYRDAKAEAEEKLADAAEEIADAEEEFLDLEKSEWLLFERRDEVSFRSIKDNIGKVHAIVRVFPVFFFFVAALVALTTMTRMVEEERGRIGTLKCLGYSDKKILSYYLGYAAAAGTLGCIIGAALCFTTLPRIIAAAYSMIIIIPKLYAPFRWGLFLLTAPSMVICTCAATLWSCMGQLGEEPASILRPRAPKVGKRVFLEYVGFVWNRLNFTAKVTVRNIFRYKKRFFMTVTGISGCCALLIAGFGIRDSVGNIASLQFEDIHGFDVNIYLDEDADTEKDENLKRFLYGGAAESHVLLASDAASSDGYAVNIWVPSDTELFESFVGLRERKSKEPVSFDENSVVITEKLSELLDVSVGDSITAELSNGIEGELVITGICENYLQNYAYMGEKACLDAFGELPPGSNILADLAPGYENMTDELTSGLLRSSGVTYVQFSSSLVKTYENSTQGIDYIVLLVVLASGLLAVVVLYNLTNINICERRKELATLMVLGFHESESALYIYRETAVLSVIGTLCGALLGTWLHRFIVLNVEAEISMFVRNVAPLSYLLASAITLGFAAVVGFMLYPSIRKTDMVEAMKSGE